MIIERRKQVISALEQDEIEFAKTVLHQLEDNQKLIQDHLKQYKATGNQNDMDMLLHEVEKQSEQTKILFIAAGTFLNTATNNIGKALELLHN